MRKLFPLFALVVLGCSASEGFKAEEVPSKAEIQKQIDGVKNSPSIPAGMKSTIVAGLEKKLATAK